LFTFSWVPNLILLTLLNTQLGIF